MMMVDPPLKGNVIYFYSLNDSFFKIDIPPFYNVTFNIHGRQKHELCCCRGLNSDSVDAGLFMEVHAQPATLKKDLGLH